jgi:hypothetical protein
MAMFRGSPLVAHAAETLRDFAPDQLIAVVSSLDMASELDGFTCIPVNGVSAEQSGGPPDGGTPVRPIWASSVAG